MAFLSKLFGKKDKDNDKKDEILDNEYLETDSEELTEEELTDEEIAEAERLEAELADETNSSDALEGDGDFSEFTEFKAEQEAEIVEETIAEDTVEEADTEEEEEKVSFWERLKNGLSKTKKALFGSVHELLKNFVSVDEDLLDELEELLIMADVGVGATEEIIEELRDRIKDGRLKEKDQVLDTLKEILAGMIGEHQPLKLETTPSVILVIGVNGAGKTTSIGKISKRLRLAGKKVVVAAADTFRAAAIDQLEVWCQRAKVDIVKQNEGSDPAAVVFDAINYAKKKQADVLVIDTAGRLHNKKT